MANRTLASKWCGVKSLFSEYWPALIAVAAGVIITIWAFCTEPPTKTYVLEENGFRFTLEKTLHEKLVEWAHHFGPELIILFVAVAIVQRHVDEHRKRDLLRQQLDRKRDVLRQQLVEGLRRLLRYSDDKNGFFTGDSIMTLDNEADTLRHIWKTLEESVKEILTDEEQRLFGVLINEHADKFLGPARACAPQADKWFEAGARLGVHLRKSARTTAQSQITDEDCKLFDALNDQARTVLNAGRAVDGPAVEDDSAQVILGELTSLIDELKNKTGSPLVDLVGELTVYRDDLRNLFKLKSDVLKGTAGFRGKYIPIRNAVWRTSSPYAL